MRRSNGRDAASPMPAQLLAGLAFVVGRPAAASSVESAAWLEARPPAGRHASLPLDQAIEIAERQYRARVVRAGVEESGGRRIYVLRLVSEQGRVWTVRVDAQSGSMF